MKRSGPLKSKTRLRSKRTAPRRSEGRITHGRIKEKPARDPNAEERRFHQTVRECGCLVCGGPATIHHVTSDGHKRIARSHQRVAPLCSIHHQKVFDPTDADPVSVEGLSHAGFTERFGIDLLKWASDAWDRREAPEHPFWSDGIIRLRMVAASSDLDYQQRRRGACEGRTTHARPA